MRPATRLRLPLASWPLVDQGVISLGTFLFNIVLARNVELASYGRFAMFLGVLSLLQAACGSVLFYPLTVRAASVSDAVRLRLIVTTLLLTIGACIPMALILGAVVWRAIDAALLLPAFAVLLASQIQEAARRGLLCQFRHRAAILGDAASYLGQAALLLLVVAGSTGIDLPHALALMAATSLIGASIQLWQLKLLRVAPLPRHALLRDFWSLGKWSLTSNFLGVVRLQSLPWLLAAASGPAAAGAFQVALNIFNMTSPVLTGICNIVPQVAAGALGGGPRKAWRAAWPFIGAGIPIICGFALLMLLAPAQIVSLVYGSVQDADAMTALRILALASLFNYAAAAGCAYLHGMEAGRDGLVADLTATLAMLVAAVPLTMAYGLAGGCVAFAMALALRTGVIGVAVLKRTGRPRLQFRQATP